MPEQHATIIAYIVFAFNTIGVFVLIKKFVWDSRHFQAQEQKSRNERDIQIKNWIVEAIAQQNAHCTLLSKISIERMKSDDVMVREKQKLQDAEIKELKTDIRKLSDAVIGLTQEINNLKIVLKDMKA